MRFISWVTFVRKLWMNPWNICKFVCRGPSVETWPCTSQFLKLGPENFDTWFGPSSPKQYLANSKKRKNGRHMAGQKFSKIMKLMKSQRIVFFFFSSPSTVLVNSIQITCHLFFFSSFFFRSELEKMSASTAILACFEGLGRPSLYQVLRTCTQCCVISSPSNEMNPNCGAEVGDTPL